MTVTTRTMLSIQAIPDVSAIRTAELIGQEHTVIPCICLTEGVLWPANAPHPELALAEEFGRFPEGWNGRPVVLNHPKDADGTPVAANSPGVLENYGFGQMFNTRLVGNKLHTEIWINNARVEELGEEFKDVVERLKSGDDVVEVSTGLFTMQEMVDGEFEGESYSGIWRNIVPDHLAILPLGLVGACSVEDGCGAPRLNKGTVTGDIAKALNIKRLKPVMNSAVLRDCNDAAPVIACGCDDEKEQDSLFKRIMETAGNILNFRSFGTLGGDKTSVITDNSEHLSDNDIRAALNMAINIVEDDRFFFIITVFHTNDAGQVIYELGFDGDLFSRTFSIASDTGVISLSEERTKVRPVTQFIPVEVSTTSNVQNAQQETDMKREDLVKALIDNEGTQYTESDTEMLLTLEDALLEKMTPVVANVTADPVINAAAEAKPVTADDYINSAPKEIQAVLNQGLSMQRERKDVLIKGILANARNTFSEASLGGKDLGELESIAALTGDVSYGLMGAVPVVNAGGESESNFTEAPKIWGNEESAA